MYGLRIYSRFVINLFFIWPFKLLRWLFKLIFCRKPKEELYDEYDDEFDDEFDDEWDDSDEDAERTVYRITIETFKEYPSGRKTYDTHEYTAPSDD